MTNIRAAICTIGDEILSGHVIDTNSSFISAGLEGLGLKVGIMLSISDNGNAITDSLKALLRTNEVVVTTGGLGPTKDDITKTALFELSGAKEWVLNEGQLAVIEQRLSHAGIEKLESNRGQALVPDTCEVLVNHFGTAPIMVFKTDEGHRLYALPGVPHEARNAMSLVENDLKKYFSTAKVFHKHIMTYGIAESALAEKIKDWEAGLPSDIHLSYLPNTLKGVELRLSVYGRGISDGSREIESQLKALREILGDHIYNEEGAGISETIGNMLGRFGETVSCAESCTGGLIAHLFTSVPGSSAYFLGGVVSYAESVKTALLGVPAELINRFGVVSSEVATAMAEGVRKATGSTYSVATTGFAGPGGDSVGEVWVGISGPHGSISKRFFYPGNGRQVNIERFASSALNLLRLYISEH